MGSFKEHTVTYDNGQKRIHYLSAGPPTGPLLIFIHGWPAIAATWKPQLELFASLGFYAIAPDMPGYGNSTANKVTTDYSNEAVVQGLLAMLADTNRTSAVWIGHDWGAGVISSLAATHPEVCHAMAWLAVPYGTIEYGKDLLLKMVNRDIYPENEYPNGQWDYQAYYEESFEKATSWFDANIPAIMKLFYSKSSPSALGQPAFTSNVRKAGGWFNGAEHAPDIPLSATMLDEPLYNELVAAMTKTSFWPADAYYMNHARNAAFNLQHRKNDGVLAMPCLFIQARYDTICDTVNSRILEPMTRMCTHFSFVNVDAGHWVALEAPVKTNAALVSWLVKEVPDYWPGGLQNAVVTHRR